jgi:hypothetical protein
MAVASAVLTAVTPARAQPAEPPGCTAAACPDGDGDGFIACTCAPTGTTCDCDDADPTTFPGAPELCDATKDRSCNGVAGESCGTKRGCLRGACVPECIPLDDFGCAPFAQCEEQPSGQQLCSGRDCSVYGCAAGSTCDDANTCVPNCNAGVRCPTGQRCRGFGCVDPCDGVVCAAGAVCQDGRCAPSCDCSPASTGCAPAEVCDRSAPVARCIEQACAGVVCPAATHCAAGRCVDDCEGVVCPPKRVCRPVASATASTGGPGTMRGSCIDLCAPNPCPLPLVCDWRNGACLEPTFPDGGLQPVTEPTIDDGLFVGGAGFTCTTAGIARASVTGGIVGALSLGLLLARRSRRRSRRR